jgi:hypothetical protein
MKDKSNAGHKHTASDRALDQAAQDQKVEAKGPGHDPAEIAKHDDVGKDRLFEGRQQHDEADKNSEKNRLAKDVDRHKHPVDDQVADSGTGPSAKQKS